ncbi:MAG: AlpA family phage regulatory protein [Mesorhizobium sp.]
MPRPDRIIRLKTVLDRTGLSRSTIYRKIDEGTFPAQLRISTNGAGWKESDINRWVADPVRWRPVNDNAAPVARRPRNEFDPDEF